MNQSPKQLKSIAESTARLNIWQGAVRSGKTYSSIFRFLQAIRHGIPGDAMIVGVSRESIQRNIVSELCKFVGCPEPSSKNNETKMFGRKIHFVGASDERAVSKIQGSTLAYSYVDEATRIPAPFFKMLLSRLSITGAQLFATCNPEAPRHWLKKDFLDRESDLNLRTWRFTLDDNPSLSEEYKENLKAEYQGHPAWYQRYIKGEWAVAQGLVYDSFDQDNIYDQESYSNPTFYAVGLDYGITNPTAAVLGAINPRQWPQIRIIDTYYFDASQSSRSKTNSELAEDIKKWLEAYPVKTIYVDPSAASFKLELQRLKLPVKDAVNDVLNGIQIVGKFIGGKNLLIKKSCKKLIEELYSYSWDPKAADRGEDRPIKSNDHLSDSLRYLISAFPKGTFGEIDKDLSIAAIRQRAYNENLNDMGFNSEMGYF